MVFTPPNEPKVYFIIKAINISVLQRKKLYRLVSNRIASRPEQDVLGLADGAA